MSFNASRRQQYHGSVWIRGSLGRGNPGRGFCHSSSSSMLPCTSTSSIVADRKTNSIMSTTLVVSSTLVLSRRAIVTYAQRLQEVTNDSSQEQKVSNSESRNGLFDFSPYNSSLVDPITEESDSVFSSWCNSFTDLEIHPELIRNLKRLGIAKPTHIQADAFKELSSERDTAICSETGSGKTLAYLLPLLNKNYYMHQFRETTISSTNPFRSSSARPCVILAPCADLCMQILHQIQMIDIERKVTVQILSKTWAPWAGGEENDMKIYGSMFTGNGNNTSKIARNHRSNRNPVIANSRIQWEGVDIVISTVQKFAEAMEEENRNDKKSSIVSSSNQLSSPLLDNNIPSMIIMDEADQLFHGATRTYVYDIFARLRPRLKIRQPDEVRERLPKLLPCQFVFVAASMVHIGPLSVGNMLIERFCNMAYIKSSGAHKLPGSIKVDWIENASHDWNERVESLVGLLKRLEVDDQQDKKKVMENRIENNQKKVIIFVNKSDNAMVLRNYLSDKGWPVVSYAKGKAGKMGPRMRDGRRFMREECQYLITTDLGGRGIDWPDVSYVINFEMPRDTVTFLHRAGRTGRIGKSGRVISFIPEGGDDLADQIRNNLGNLEKAFSLKRSFRKYRKNREQMMEGRESSLSSFGTDGIIEWSDEFKASNYDPMQKEGDEKGRENEESTLIGWTYLGDEEEDDINSRFKESENDESESPFDKLRRKLLDMGDEEESTANSIKASFQTTSQGIKCSPWSNLGVNENDLPPPPRTELWNRPADGYVTPPKPEKLRNIGMKSVLRNLDDDVRL